MIRIDLHTHSIASPDGGITLDQYKSVLGKKLDYIAITDHNRIDFALDAHKKLGDKIIVGEEIMTQDGEIIGLFLTKKILPFQGLNETIQQIKQQNGLVYVPHPFEAIRSGIAIENLKLHVENLDIIETINGRALSTKKSKQAIRFANKHKISHAVSSDSHGINGWGISYSIIEKRPSRTNLVSLLSQADYAYKKPGMRAILYPKYNRIKKALS